MDSTESSEGHRTSSTTPGLANDPTLIAEDVWIQYSAYEERRTKLRDAVSRPNRGRVDVNITAVRGVSFTCKKGEVIGIVGANGSGKSSLLQALSGALPVTAGRVSATAQPMLLGVGSALNKGLSGRRNVHIGLMALGFSREGARVKAQEVIDFAALSDAIDRPLKTYSTGMRARLQFAVATCIRPQILLIDELLAVGDKDFKRRSRTRIGELRDDSGTVLIVSHNLRELEEYCTRLIWLDAGVIRKDGSPTEVAEDYA